MGDKGMGGAGEFHSWDFLEQIYQISFLDQIAFLEWFGLI